MFRREDRTAIRRKVAKEGTADETVDRARSERLRRRFGAWLASVRLLVLSYHQLQNRRGGRGCFIPFAVPGESAWLRANCLFRGGDAGRTVLHAHCAAGSCSRSARRQHDVFLHDLGIVLGAGPLLLPPDLGFSCVLHLGKSFRRTRSDADLDGGELRPDNPRGQARVRGGGGGGGGRGGGGSVFLLFFSS